MPDCAFCGATDAEVTTTDFEEREGSVVIRVEGVPAVRCRSCQEGREPAVTLGVAKALQTAYELIFDAASASESILTGTNGTSSQLARESA
jgi:YgiT-type zinc finger domain-containing protein